MTSKITRGLEILRQQGLRDFIQEFRRYISNVSVIEELWIRIKRNQTFLIRSTSAKFKMKNSKMKELNEWRYESEYEVLDDFLNEVQDQDVIFDVGANTGLYTCFAAVKNQSVNVVAFEPYQPNVEVLKKNIKLNSVENVRIIDTALSNTNGTAKFEVPGYDMPGYGTGSISDNIEDTKTVNIQTSTGDDLIEEGLQQPNVLKIDVEGAEERVLEGLLNTMAEESCRLVYCEVHDDSGESVDTFLTDCGFKTKKLSKRGNQHFIKAFK